MEKNDFVGLWGASLDETEQEDAIVDSLKKNGKKNKAPCMLRSDRSNL